MSTDLPTQQCSKCKQIKWAGLFDTNDAVCKKCRDWELEYRQHVRAVSISIILGFIITLILITLIILVGRIFFHWW